MNKNLLVYFSLLQNSVNGAYFFGKFFKISDSPVVASSGPVSIPALVEAPKKIVYLDELVDEEDRAQFEAELAWELGRMAEIKAKRRAEYIASLPKDFDSMEMISREAQLRRINGQLEWINEAFGYLGGFNYGHSQYSDSEGEDVIVEVIEKIADAEKVEGDESPEEESPEEESPEEESPEEESPESHSPSSSSSSSSQSDSLNDENFEVVQRDSAESTFEQVEKDTE